MGLFDGLFNRNRSAASTPYNPNPHPLSGFGPALAGLGVEIATNRPGGGAGAFTAAAHQLGRRREIAADRAMEWQEREEERMMEERLKREAMEKRAAQIEFLSKYPQFQKYIPGLRAGLSDPRQRFY